MLIAALIGTVTGAALAAVFLLIKHHRAALRQQLDLHAQESQALALREQWQTAQSELEHLRQQLAAAHSASEQQREAHHALAQDYARLQQAQGDAERHHAEQLRLLQDARQQMSEQFRALSAEILNNNSQQLAQSQNERLQHLLKPFDERLQAFGEQVRRSYETEMRERVSLKEELKLLALQGERMTREADGLARALKGEAKTRGDWGEVILERVLEQSGLRRDAEYRIQATHHDDEQRRFQPDVIIDLPDHKHLVIDSKLSLISWLKVQEADGEEAYHEALRGLVASTRNHVRSLSTKAYERLPGLNTVDFVLCFIPVEAAFSCVVNADPELYREAMERNVILVSPTTLLATMRTVALTWRSERQERNALKIATEAGRMYDQLVAYAESLSSLGQRLDQAQASYQQARKRLVDGRGNLIRRAENVRQLGARAAKRLGQDLVAEADEHGEDDGEEEDGYAGIDGPSLADGDGPEDGRPSSV